jgi:hypothetical protein
VLVAGVGNEMPVDDIRDPALERADCFFGRFAFGDFAVEVGAAQIVVSEL